MRSAIVPFLRVAEGGPRSRACRIEAKITLFVLPLILAFAPVAVGALRRVGGLRRLWLLCAPSRSLALLLVPSGSPWCIPRWQ